MTIEEVSWQLIEGVKSLGNLIYMVHKVLPPRKSSGKLKPASAHEWMGYYIWVKSRKYFVGVWLSNPGSLVFEDELEKRPEQKQVVPPLDLESPKIHFFALAKENQQQAVERFVDKGLRKLGASRQTS